MVPLLPRETGAVEGCRHPKILLFTRTPLQTSPFLFQSLQLVFKCIEAFRRVLLSLD